MTVSLPMYDWPEARAEVDAQWSRIRGALWEQGVEAPAHLVRRNADMPAVPGGIRDRAGRLVAPDPATLPPEELDYATLWRHPRMADVALQRLVTYRHVARFVSILERRRAYSPTDRMPDVGVVATQA